MWNPLSTLSFLDSWGSQQSKERIITGAGLGQPGTVKIASPSGPVGPDGRVQLTNPRKSQCNCLHGSTIEKCCLAIKICDFPYLVNLPNIYLKFSCCVVQVWRSWSISTLLFDTSSVVRYLWGTCTSTMTCTAVDLRLYYLQLYSSTAVLNYLVNFVRNWYCIGDTAVPGVPVSFIWFSLYFKNSNAFKTMLLWYVLLNLVHVSY
jgi:hypothetical protein